MNVKGCEQVGLRIITDSVSDIPKELVDQYSITVLPLMVTFGEDSYLDGVEISNQDFFDKLKAASKPPTTAQVSPGRFQVAFEEAVDAGDEVIGVFMASRMSGTYAAAVYAATLVNPSKISCIDSEGITFGYGLLVLEAAQMAETGKSRSEIVERIEYLKHKLENRYIVDTLEYLLKGGRLSPINAMVGSLLNIKPILTCVDGELKVAAKVRGRKKALSYLIEWLSAENISLDGKTVALYHAVDEEYMKEVESVLAANFKVKEFVYSKVGCVVGTHSGPSCVAISFFNE